MVNRINISVWSFFIHMQNKDKVARHVGVGAMESGIDPSKAWYKLRFKSPHGCTHRHTELNSFH